MSELAADPEVPADGTCAKCGGERRFRNLKPVYLEPAKADPFCTTLCARAWYGISLPEPTPRDRRAYVSKLPESG